MVTSLVVFIAVVAAESAALFFIVKRFGFKETVKAFGVAVADSSKSDR